MMAGKAISISSFSSSFKATPSFKSYQPTSFSSFSFFPQTNKSFVFKQGGIEKISSRSFAVEKKPAKGGNQQASAPAGPPPTVISPEEKYARQLERYNKKREYVNKIENHQFIESDISEFVKSRAKPINEAEYPSNVIEILNEIKALNMFEYRYFQQLFQKKMQERDNLIKESLQALNAKYTPENP